MKKILLIFLLSAFVVNVKAQNPSLKSTTLGKKISSQCVACHGDNGISVIEEAPNLAGQKDLYIWNQLRDYKSGKRQNEIMTIIAKNLTDDEMKDVAAYYGQFKITVVPPK
ncbi:MAG: cytochrome c [Candidatus Fonsibacter sp.]|nr:cytochrome c [Candidatus Fonsibacter sp.]